MDTRIKAANKQLAALVTETGSGLMRLNGIGPSGAARRVGDIGDVSRFPTKAHFASWNGTAPLDASSGEQTRHRLSRAGNRRLNRACTSWPSSNSGTPAPTAAATTTAGSPKAKPRWKPCGRSNAGCPM
jgi:transposase